MKSEKTKIDALFINENNPRFIRDHSFEKLVASIKEFPLMLEMRPIIVDENMVVLGGNMRLKACEEVGMKEVPYRMFTRKMAEENNKRLNQNLTYEEYCAEFIIKDNLSFGEWDMDMLANNFDAQKLESWGLHTIGASKFEMDNFFAQDNENKDKNKNKITLEFSAEDYALVIAAFDKLEGSKEAIVFKLLGL